MEVEEEEEDRNLFLPEQDYGNPDVISTYDFIYFVQDYSPFLRKYIDYLYDPNPEDHEEAGVNGYFKSFIDICEGINTDQGDDGHEFEQYRPTLEPLMEFMTQSSEDMNVYYNEQLRPENLADAPTGIAYRTRSKALAPGFQLPPPIRRRNVMTLGPLEEGARIELSDGKDYNYSELKNMLLWNKTITPNRHPYTPEDKEKIQKFIEFVTKGGKKTKKNKRKGRKTKKTRKTRKSKTRKSKKTKK